MNTYGIHTISNVPKNLDSHVEILWFDVWIPLLRKETNIKNKCILWFHRSKLVSLWMIKILILMFLLGFRLLYLEVSTYNMYLAGLPGISCILSCNFCVFPLFFCRSWQWEGVTMLLDFVTNHTTIKTLKSFACTVEQRRILEFPINWGQDHQT